MKGIYGLLSGVYGLAATGRGTATTYGVLGQSAYSHGDADNLESQNSLSSQHAPFSRQGVLSPEVVHQGSFLRSRDSETVWYPPLLVTQMGSLLQLRSEKAEEEPDESEDSEGDGTSTAESGGEQEKPTSSENAKENASDNEKPDDTNAKDANVEGSSTEGENSNSSGTEATKTEASDEDESGTKHEAAVESHSAKEEDTEQPSQSSESAKQKATQAVDKNGAVAHAKEAGGEDVDSTEFGSLFNRLRVLLKASKGKDLFRKVSSIIDLHEKAEQAEKELNEEAAKSKGKSEDTKKPAQSAAAQADLLLSQQLSNMWVLPFHEESKRDTCLSGFEKLTHEATITCKDPECFKLETQAKQCPYMHVRSILRKDALEKLQGSSTKAGTGKPAPQKDHMLLGFDGVCKQAENLGKEVLSILQRPKNLAKKHALEQTTGISGSLPIDKHHLDLICDQTNTAEYPACKTVYEALQHFSKPQSRALPELLVLTDIQDLSNTLGLYRITFLFEGLVQFASPDGTKLDASSHKLPKADAEFVHTHRHDSITSTVMLTNM